MNIIRISKIGVAAAAVLMLGSCNIYKKYETPQSSTLTRAYAEARQESVDSAAFGNLLWEDVFTDPILVDLINQALENNTNLRNAKLNVDIAHAQLKGAKLAYLPSLTLAPNGAGSSYDGSALSWTYTLPLQASWEVDIFGKLLNSKRGAQAAVYQSEAYAQAVRSQIIAGVANTYYALVATKSQLELSRSTAGLWAETVQTMKDLKLSGGITEAGVVQSAAAYYSILASITDLEAAVDKLNNTMSLLVNVMPQEWNVPSTINMQLPNILREGVPMRELACRPDVAAAEQSLATAYYATNSARAAFYPGLTISATGGFTNILGSFIQNPGVWFYNLAGSLTAPLFSRGQNIARLEAAKAQQEQALNNFEYTLLSAAAEVKDALTYLVDQVDQLTKSVDYTKELLLYSTGSVNYLEVLTAQQNLLSAQISQISCQLSQAQAIINLYQSLGGGR
jgi:NodT family efflux transporter outer membrane factor (OMF) lipoprotein